MNAVALAFWLLLVAASAVGLLRVDRRTLRPVLTTTALVIALSGYVATLLH